MKQEICAFILTVVLFAGSLSANPASPERDAAKAELPKTPAELLQFMSGTTWRLKSANGQYDGEGTLFFRGKGIVEHLYEDGVIHKKHWGVTSDMKVIWGGTYLQTCRFSLDFKTFVGSRNETAGRRVSRSDKPKVKVTVKG